ncbi:hypothetical protein ACFZA2_15330 [Microbacterium sp. NPDC007973]|uniref:hypothetical protein n=1 Tax=Microbacterium sp. NPDC007973 TaxID=3364182 RepID=UPI0036E478B0
MDDAPTIHALEVSEDAEDYRFMYVGAFFGVRIEPAGPATTEPPNLRTLAGSWQTWRLEVDPIASGLAGVRLLRSVGADGGEHPNGNLSAAAAGPGEYRQMMVTSDGLLYFIPSGYSVASRFYSTAAWSDQLAVWEAELRSSGSTVA